MLRRSVTNNIDPKSTVACPDSSRQSLFNAMSLNDTDAMKAYWKEWKNLEARKVWRWETLREWADVSAEARAREEEVHLGFLFGLMVEKGSEFQKDDPRRYFKYRIVFRGNDVKDQNYEVAMFQEMATTPTTLEASRYSSLLACLPGTQWRDVMLDKLTFMPIGRVHLPT